MFSQANPIQQQQILAQMEDHVVQLGLLMTAIGNKPVTDASCFFHMVGTERNQFKNILAYFDQLFPPALGQACLHDMFKECSGADFSMHNEHLFQACLNLFNHTKSRLASAPALCNRCRKSKCTCFKM